MVQSVSRVNLAPQHQLTRAAAIPVAFWTPARQSTIAPTVLCARHVGKVLSRWANLIDPTANVNMATNHKVKTHVSTLMSAQLIMIQLTLKVARAILPVWIQSYASIMTCGQPQKPSEPPAAAVTSTAQGALIKWDTLSVSRVYQASLVPSTVALAVYYRRKRL